MICPYPIHLKPNKDLPNQAWYDRIVPCGKCGACNYNYQQDWIFRLRWELLDTKTVNASFWTFTYRDDELPYVNEETGEVLDKPTLDPRDLTLFLKRLRMHSKRKLRWGEKIRYYSVAEYGSMYERPHFHAIIFNLPPRFLEIDIEDGKGNGWNTAMEDIWGKGICHFGEVTSRSIAYCAKFHMLPNNRFEDDGRIKEHSRMSRRPYLGNFYERSNKRAHKENGNLYVLTPSGSKRRMPKIYKNKIFTDEELARNKEEMFDEITKRNQDILDDLEERGKEDPLAYYEEMLINKEQTVKRHAKSKKGLY